MKLRKREAARILLEALETVRELRKYWEPRAGEVHRTKTMLRKAGVPIPRPRKGD